MLMFLMMNIDNKFYHSGSPKLNDYLSNINNYISYMYIL